MVCPARSSGTTEQKGGEQQHSGGSVQLVCLLLLFGWVVLVFLVAGKANLRGCELNKRKKKPPKHIKNGRLKRSRVIKGIQCPHLSTYGHFSYRNATEAASCPTHLPPNPSGPLSPVPMVQSFSGNQNALQSSHSGTFIPSIICTHSDRSPPNPTCHSLSLHYTFHYP